MASTKRKRQTKHRGNAAGSVVTRGRTGRPPSPEEKKKQTRDEARIARQTKKPTWNSAALRGALASVFIFLFLLVSTHFRILPSLVFGLGAAVLYIPTGFYLETYLWRRRMRKLGRPTT